SRMLLLLARPRLALGKGRFEPGNDPRRRPEFKMTRQATGKNAPRLHEACPCWPQGSFTRYRMADPKVEHLEPRPKMYLFSGLCWVHFDPRRTVLTYALGILPPKMYLWRRTSWVSWVRTTLASRLHLGPFHLELPLAALALHGLAQEFLRQGAGLLAAGAEGA